MRIRWVLALLIIGLLSGRACAFSFAPVDFGQSFNEEASRQGSSLRVDVGRCDASRVQSCTYTTGDLVLAVHGREGTRSAGRVVAQSGPLNGTIELAEVQPIIAAMCSPLTDDGKRKTYLFALRTAYDNDEVASPRVRVVLNGVRYVRQKLPGNTGETFEVADSGSWAEEPRPSQVQAEQPGSPSAPVADSTSAAEHPSATTKDIVDDHAPGEFKNVDVMDLFVAPGKFKGKPVELRNVQCFYADADEYRCIATNSLSPVMILAGSVGPEGAKTALEDACGTIKAVDTPTCTRTIHFVPTAFEEDQLNAFSKRMVLATPHIEIVTRRK